jgi:hypothetical protein
MLWIVPLLAASTTWSFADVFSDVFIDHLEASGESSSHLYGELPITPKEHSSKQSSLSGRLRLLQEERKGKLSGDQAAFVQAVAMLPCILVFHLLSSETMWMPNDPAWQLAVLSGFLNACATFMLCKAYEEAPSTVIVPLLQLTAVFVFVVSTIVTALAPEFPIFASEAGAYLNFKDFLAYCVILIGGLYPAAQGNTGTFLDLRFWRQGFVVLLLFYDFLSALSYEIVELCTSVDLGMTPERFMITSSYSGVLFYAIFFLSLSHLRLEALGVRYALPKYVMMCGLAEFCNWFALYLATLAYHLHQVNVSIINAGEVATNQIMNLVTAYGLLFLFKFGRTESVAHMRTKILSCGLVTSGIILATVTFGSPEAHSLGLPGHGTPLVLPVDPVAPATLLRWNVSENLTLGSLPAELEIMGTVLRIRSWRICINSASKARITNTKLLRLVEQICHRHHAFQQAQSRKEHPHSPQRHTHHTIALNFKSGKFRMYPFKLMHGRNRRRKEGFNETSSQGLRS